LSSTTETPKHGMPLISTSFAIMPPKTIRRQRATLLVSYT
jgi:hypothetical protein